MLRIPHYLDNRPTDGGKVVSPMHRLGSSTKEILFFCFWYSFMLEAELTPGTSAAGSSIYVIIPAALVPGFHSATNNNCVSEAEK
jgi:hypothetical protein